MAGFSFASKPNPNDAGLIGTSPLAGTQKAHNDSFHYSVVIEPSCKRIEGL